MNTELDKVKSTITISLGLKNRLRDVKGSSSYEEYIAQLLRMRNETAHNGNYIELQKFQRREKVYSSDDWKIVFSYNKYNNSPNFVFDIIITIIRKNGQKLLGVSQLYSVLRNNATMEKNEVTQNHDEHQIFGYKLYFELLTLAIQTEIEPLFKHKGRFEDYYLWQKEFERLGLQAKAYENDVMEKLNDYKNGVIF